MRLRELKKLNKLATPENLDAVKLMASQWKAANAALAEGAVAPQALDHFAPKSYGAGVRKEPAQAALFARPIAGVKLERAFQTSSSTALPHATHKARATSSGIPYPPKPSVFPAIQKRIAQMEKEVARREQILAGTKR